MTVDSILCNCRAPPKLFGSPFVSIKRKILLRCTETVQTVSYKIVDAFIYARRICYPIIPQEKPDVVRDMVQQKQKKRLCLLNRCCQTSDDYYLMTVILHRTSV